MTDQSTLETKLPFLTGLALPDDIWPDVTNGIAVVGPSPDGPIRDILRRLCPDYFVGGRPRRYDQWAFIVVRDRNAVGFLTTRETIRWREWYPFDPRPSVPRMGPPRPLIFMGFIAHDWRGHGTGASLVKGACDHLGISPHDIVWLLATIEHHELRQRPRILRQMAGPQRRILLDDWADPIQLATRTTFPRESTWTSPR